MANKTRNLAKFISDNNIFVDVDNDRVGVGTTQPNSKFQVVGVVSATSFYGDGSGLTGLSTFSGNYNDLTNKPTIPTDTGDLTNNVGFVTSGIVVGYATEGYVDAAVVGFITSGALVGYATTGYVDAAVAAVGVGSTTLDGVLKNGNTSSLGMSVGVITATSIFAGSVRQTVTGTSVNASFFPLFVSSIQPNQYLEAHSGLLYNPSTGIMTATRFSGSFAGTLALDLDAQSSRKIINLTDPVNAQDSATKSYVDARTQDLADNRLVYTRNADTNETGGTNAVLNWNSDVVASTIPDFTHSSGVFTNTSTRTRRFVFNLQCAIRAQSTAFTEADLWFSINGTVSSTNRRGQVAYVGSTTGTILSTSWTFTMAQNDTVRCYAYANQAFTYGNTSPGSSFGNAYSALVEVQELN